MLTIIALIIVAVLLAFIFRRLYILEKKLSYNDEARMNMHSDLAIVHDYINRHERMLMEHSDKLQNYICNDRKWNH